MDEFSFGKSVRKLPKNLEEVLFYETYLEECNINQKPLIWSHNKIITKFTHKKMGEFGIGQSARKVSKN